MPALPSCSGCRCSGCRDTRRATLLQLSDSVLLTHLRTELRAEEERLSLSEGTDESGVALPGGGEGKQFDEPVDRLSTLIAALNERFGMNLGDADRVWFEQQLVDAKSDDALRVIALNNDRAQYQVASDRRAEERLIERHAANGELFGAVYARPEFKRRLFDFLAEVSYRYFREEGA